MGLDLSKKEEKILKFWKKEKIFEKSLEKTKKGKRFVFYDGPPFATGLPHYGHILSSVIKDVVPRYWTMKGYYIPRRWGWDCHGLPIETLIEKELGVLDKKDIENKIGIEKFNNACCSRVLTYAKEWKKMIDRIGRWVEFDNAYKTMDSTYIESVWWAIKTIWEKGLIYEGRKVLMYCPRCETSVSKAEVAMDNSYKEVIEEAVTVKFKIKKSKNSKIILPSNTYILAWTTTPWTLPGNVALAVGKEIKYSALKIKGEKCLYILAKDRIKDIIKERKYEIIKQFKGSDLKGLEYEPLYEISAVKNSGKNAWFLTEADFVNTEEGTGVVHTAVIYGEDDYQLGTKIDLPMIPLLDSKGIFNDKAPRFISGKYFKSSEKFIKEDLDSRGLLFSSENHTHSYPFCWRCETQLFYNAISSWFIDVQKIKSRLIKLNEKINWYPSHLKHGRFLNILKTAPDWNISRNRYWASPLPFWKCGCGEKVCIGSIKELKNKAVNFSKVYRTDKIERMDLHKHKIDKIKLICAKCGEEMNRIPEVIDCWMESASMPFAEFHYPFENKKIFEQRFPAQYIAEYIAQTRTWFYYMHVMAVLLFDDISFENVVSTGTILNEKGEKLSKSKLNYTDPWIIIEKYGMDSLRYYLMSGVVMQSENIFFNDREVRDVYNKVINILWNVSEFYKMYVEKSSQVKIKGLIFENVLDRWILSRLQNLIKEVTEQMDNYNTIKSCRSIKDFIEDLSLWYVRRSRSRFKNENKKDKNQAIVTLNWVLLDLSKVIAPFMPFIAETLYQKVRNDGEKSVHLSKWPKFSQKFVNKNLEKKMEEVRRVVSFALAKRAEVGIKVRQPLKELRIKNNKLKNDSELLNLIKEEINVKEIVFDNKIKQEVKLDTKITKELEREGNDREFIRRVNIIRKEKGLKPKDSITIDTTYSPLEMESVKDGTNSIKINTNSESDMKGGDTKEIEISNKKYFITIKNSKQMNNK